MKAKWILLFLLEIFWWQITNDDKKIKLSWKNQIVINSYVICMPFEMIKIISCLDDKKQLKTWIIVQFFYRLVQFCLCVFAVMCHTNWLGIEV